MAVPTKAAQIQAVASYLEILSEDELLEDVAKRVVEGYHALLTRGLKSPASPARLGMLFKTPLDGKIRRFVWGSGDADTPPGEEKVWIVGETDSYGWLGPFPGPLLEYCEEYRPKRRRDGKMVELTDAEIEQEWSNPDWKVGDVLSQHQRQYSFEIIATAQQSALLRGADGRLTVDSNSNLKQYYKREVKGLEGGW